ncbi:hydroxyacylglutathione hydrolase [Halioxenophilus sp. WMMB6]|uniref:hydroxyacylglutathione hydrolase n=1 Tax=Halioxenophilus sp. WMMB6 TaxID=3073815 RepID=UPI00295EE521|nr:hydroxyacylglutathione hydrolase [Halioxenophilus sp. WMMB6]
MTQASTPLQPQTLNITAIPAFTDNYIWLIEDRSANCSWLVDPGDADAVINYLHSRNITNLKGILVTHHHPDHIGGIEKLMRAYPGIAIYGVESSRVTMITNAVAPGLTLSLSASCQFDVLGVPGHTSDHIAYLLKSEDQPSLFCGDTLFSSGCGRLFEGTAAQMRLSLQQFRSLAPGTKIYCAHEYTLANLKFAQAVEPANADLKLKYKWAAEQRESGQPTVPSTIGNELVTNPFMRWDQAQVIAIARAHGAIDDSPDEVFKAIRQWKDHF